MLKEEGSQNVWSKTTHAAAFLSLATYKLANIQGVRERERKCRITKEWTAPRSRLFSSSTSSATTAASLSKRGKHRTSEQSEKEIRKTTRVRISYCAHDDELPAVWGYEEASKFRAVTINCPGARSGRDWEWSKMTQCSESAGKEKVPLPFPTLPGLWMPNGLGQDQQSTSWPITQNFRLLFDAGTGDSPEGLIELNIKTSTHAKAETEEEGKGEENGSSSPSATWRFAISYRFFRVNVAFEGQFSPSPFPNTGGYVTGGKC